MANRQKDNQLALVGEEYEKLIEELRNLISERKFTIATSIIEFKHEVGDRIVTDPLYKKFGKQSGKFINKIADDLGVSKTDIYYCVQFREKYPVVSNALETLRPENKTLHWSDIIKSLPAPKENKAEIPLPKGKFNVIYADPPWAYDVDLSSGATRSPLNNYPVMDLAALKEFGTKVKQIANSDCVLFMWTTAPKLNWVNDVLEAWGFEYKTNLIWDKIKPNLGHYSSVRHEILVIAGKGKCAPTCDGKTIQSIDSVQAIEKTPTHSQKPIRFMEIIETLYPNSKKVELFARNKRKGWTSWGNEIDADI